MGEVTPHRIRIGFMNTIDNPYLAPAVHPNPTTGQTGLRLTTPGACEVTVDVFDAGREMAAGIIRCRGSAGTHLRGGTDCGAMGLPWPRGAGDARFERRLLTVRLGLDPALNAGREMAAGINRRAGRDDPKP